MLDINNIKFSFENIENFEFNFKLKPATFAILTGKSGIGKTSLLNLIAGFYPLKSGNIFFDGEKIDRLKPSARKIAFLFQTDNLFPHLTAFDNIMLGIRQKSQKIDKSFLQKILLDFEIAPLMDKRPEQLSGGQKQRIALARIFLQAYFGNYKILLLDEPLSAVDKNLRRKINQEIQKLTHELKLITLLVSHHDEEFTKLADCYIHLAHDKTLKTTVAKVDIEKPSPQD